MHDIVDEILADHRRFEQHFVELRDRSRGAGERASELADLADLLVAHAVAEEDIVYPALARKDEVDDDEVEHGADEHAEGNVALADLQEIKASDTETFLEALETLVGKVNHHVNEEESTLVNDLREHTSDAQRADLAERFTARRDRLKADRCGQPAKVRKLVAATGNPIDHA